MQKGAAILVKMLFGVYIGLVLFFCFYNFPATNLDFSKYFLGIRLDRYAHFVMFFPYPFVTWLTLAYSPKLKWPNFGKVIFTFNSGLALAAITEVFQNMFFEGRQGDIFDFIADSCGIILATIIVMFLGKWMVRILNSWFKS